jgi:hypothetical protein
VSLSDVCGFVVSYLDPLSVIFPLAVPAASASSPSALAPAASPPSAALTPASQIPVLRPSASRRPSVIVESFASLGPSSGRRTRSRFLLEVPVIRVDGVVLVPELVRPTAANARRVVVSAAVAVRGETQRDGARCTGGLR